MKKYSEFVKALHESKIEEASGKNFIDVYDEDKAFDKPVYKVHRNEVIEEIKELLLGKENGYLERITVFGNLPAHGKNKPTYLADTLPQLSKPGEMDQMKPGSEEEPKIDWRGAEVEPDEDEIVISGDVPVDTDIDWKQAGIEWDKEEDPEDYVDGSDDSEDMEDDDEEGDDEDDSKKANRWVDSEFEVVDVDEVNNLIVAMPYSMRRKRITTPIHPKYIDEIYYKKVKRNAP